MSTVRLTIFRARKVLYGSVKITYPKGGAISLKSKLSENLHESKMHKDILKQAQKSSTLHPQICILQANVPLELELARDIKCNVEGFWESFQREELKDVWFGLCCYSFESVRVSNPSITCIIGATIPAIQVMGPTVLKFEQSPC